MLKNIISTLIIITALFGDTLNRITSNEGYLELCLITEVKTCLFDMSQTVDKVSFGDEVFSLFYTIVLIMIWGNYFVE
ncbi:hypothetical protein C7R57_09535 [Macrococcoides caseolyticum subsp. caseolyticum]|nr:hypothetical protein C7R57_09535 [Macrococcus caseolyticus subsp. caseolyticus]